MEDNGANGVALEVSASSVAAIAEAVLAIVEDELAAAHEDTELARRGLHNDALRRPPTRSRPRREALERVARPVRIPARIPKQRIGAH
jgi:hypothetical protein